MAKRGDIARQNVVNEIVKAFQITGSYLCTQDKKIYVNSAEGDEVFQFAISITMPKIPIDAAPAGSKATEGSVNSEVKFAATSLSDTDKQKVEELKQKLKDAGVYQE